MSNALLHLVDDEGQPVESTIRSAIESAHRSVLGQYPRIDQAIVANMAEDLAKAVSRRSDQIRSIRQYAVAAMIGKVHEWYRAHPVELNWPANDLESYAGGRRDCSFDSIDNGVLLDQMKSRLDERDRQILVLIEQDLGDSKSIALALGLTNEAAKKAIQRTREKMRTLVRNTRLVPAKNSGLLSFIERKIKTL